MGKDEHLTITSVNSQGKPLLPLMNANKFVHQCGVVVRDNVAISVQEWNKPKKLEGVSYVDNRSKDLLWDKLIAHFTLSVFENDEAKTKAMRAAVKHFTLKKMVNNSISTRTDYTVRMSKIKKLQISLAHLRGSGLTGTHFWSTRIGTSEAKVRKE